MENPFYVDPSLDITKGLQGFRTGLAFRQERKEKEKKETEEKTTLQGAVEAFQSGDPMIIAEYAIQHPIAAKELTTQAKFRDQSTKDNYINTAFKLLQNPEDAKNIVKSRQAFLTARGLTPDEREDTDSFLERYNTNPEETLAKLEKELAFMAPERYKAYKTALKTTDEDTTDIKNIEYYNELNKTNPTLAEKFATQVGITSKDKDTRTAAMKNLDHYDTLLLTDPKKAEKFATQVGINEKDKDTRTAAMKNFEHYDFLSKSDPKKAKEFGDFTDIKRVTPHSDLAKLRTDLNNGFITPEEYKEKRDKILNPTMKNKIELTMAALRGDAEAANVIKELNRDALVTAKSRSKATTAGKLEGLYDAMDLDAVADAILAGKETMDNIRNTFGVPIQEVVRAKVLDKEPSFNFVQPRAIEKSLSSSLVQQQKNRGAMGNFVLNINGQLDKVDEIMNSIIKRVGVRAIDLPLRELHTRFKGSGYERVLEAYMKEISVEIFKLSQGSTASVALLPEKGRIEWEKIHDVNLSYTQLKRILEGTRDMANIRLKSVNDEIKATVDRLENVRELENLYIATEGEAGAEFEDINTITVTNPDTDEEEVWNLDTEERIK